MKHATSVRSGALVNARGSSSKTRLFMPRSARRLEIDAFSREHELLHRDVAAALGRECRPRVLHRHDTAQRPALHGHGGFTEHRVDYGALRFRALVSLLLDPSSAIGRVGAAAADLRLDG